MILFRDRNSVRTLLSLLDQLPDELITVSFHEYTEFLQCQSALVSALSIWDAQGQGPAALNVGAKDPVERIRRILAVCHDENPPPYPDLAFIPDQNARANVQQDIRAAWIDFRSDEWKGATVFATTALEALLFWKPKSRTDVEHPERLDKQHLGEYVAEAIRTGVITRETADQV